jgi:hypothetical protein
MTINPSDIFLDIETDWSRNITVIGFYSEDTGLVQLVGAQINHRRLLDRLPPSGRLFTYNGHSFDLSCIRKELKINLRERYDSWDLRWICQRNDLRGGQKAIEDVIGYCRQTDTLGMCGVDAIELWMDFQKGNDAALELLLRYNAEDLYGMMAIRDHLEMLGILAK